MRRCAYRILVVKHIWHIYEECARLLVMTFRMDTANDVHFHYNTIIAYEKCTKCSSLIRNLNGIVGINLNGKFENVSAFFILWHCRLRMHNIILQFSAYSVAVWWFTRGCTASAFRIFVHFNVKQDRFLFRLAVVRPITLTFVHNQINILHEKYFKRIGYKGMLSEHET